MHENKIGQPAYHLQCGICRKTFIICASCYRYHRYCSEDCRTLARRQARKRANFRYRKTDHGRNALKRARIKYEEKIQNKASATPPQVARVLQTISPNSIDHTSHLDHCDIKLFLTNCLLHQATASPQIARSPPFQVGSCCSKCGKRVKSFKKWSQTWH